jgi:hypothetical protein
MTPGRRSLLALPLGLACGVLLPIRQAQAARREVEDLGLSVELPDHWVPIPRAEILEARDRAVAAGASTEWTMRAAWQQPPHLRWFSLPYLTLESHAAPGLAEAAPAIEHVAGQSGGRPVHAHRAVWRADGLDLRLSLLSFDDRRDEFESWVASLHSARAARP